MTAAASTGHSTHRATSLSYVPSALLLPQYSPPRPSTMLWKTRHLMRWRSTPTIVSSLSRVCIHSWGWSRGKRRGGYWMRGGGWPVRKGKPGRELWRGTWWQALLRAGMRRRGGRTRTIYRVSICACCFFDLLTMVLCRWQVHHREYVGTH